MTTRQEYEARLQRWAQALRDPLTRQAFNRLARTDEDNIICMCAAGVGLDASGLGTWVPCESDPRPLYFVFNGQTERYAVSMGPQAAKYYGFKEDMEYSIEGRNDLDRMSLPEIADWMEQEKASLFTWAGKAEGAEA